MLVHIYMDYMWVMQRLYGFYRDCMGLYRDCMGVIGITEKRMETVPGLNIRTLK